MDAAAPVIRRKPFWLEDAHVNGSGLVCFLCLLGAVWIPSRAQQFNDTMKYAMTYLFVAAKHK